MTNSISGLSDFEELMGGYHPHPPKGDDGAKFAVRIAACSFDIFHDGIDDPLCNWISHVV